MKRFFKVKWILLLVVILVVGFIAYRRLNPGPQVKSDTAYKVKKQDLQESLSFSGNIDAEEKSTLRFQSSGTLVWVGVKEGDWVKKYQGVASLDQRDLQMRLQKYLNSYSKTRLDFDQTSDNNNQSSIWGLSENLRKQAFREGDQAQFDLNNSVLDVQLQDLAIKEANIYSPIDGLVTRVETPETGVNITPTQAEFDIVNPQTLYFSASADQTDVVHLTSSQSGEIVLDSYPDETIQGTISSIGYTPQSGQSGTSYEVKIAIPLSGDQMKYRLGMTGDITFVTKEEKNVLSVPSSYVKSSGSKKYVIQVVNGKQIKTYVQVGDTLDTNTVIKSGLQSGDVIYD